MANRLPIQSTGIGSVAMKQGGATASQTFVRGAVLVAASGLLSEGGADPTIIVGIANHGVAAAASGDVVNYIPAYPGQEFIASVDNTAAGTGTIVATDKWSRYGLTQDSDGIWYIDKDKTTDAEARVTITDFVDPVTTLLGRVKFVFHQHGDLGGTPLAITVYAGSV